MDRRMFMAWVWWGGVAWVGFLFLGVVLLVPWKYVLADNRLTMNAGYSPIFWAPAANEAAGWHTEVALGLLLAHGLAATAAAPLVGLAAAALARVIHPQPRHALAGR